MNTYSETVGSDVVFYTAEGTIKVTKGASKDIVLMDADCNIIEIGGGKLPNGWKYGTSSATNTNASIMTATIAGADNFIDLSETYGAEVVKVDGSKITGGVEIYGNDLNNSLKGGKGADTISGGYGNDSVSLGGGADVYVYRAAMILFWTTRRLMPFVLIFPTFQFQMLKQFPQM